jgi:sigma-70-like protein
LLDRALDSWGMYLRPEEFDDTLSELIALVWKLEARFDPDKAESFSAYASWIVSQRAVDYGPRRVLGRHGTRTHNYSASEDYEGNQMGESISGFSLDDQNDRDTDVSRILSKRDSEISRRHYELGFDPDGQAPLGD